MLIEIFLKSGYNLIVMIMDGIIGIIMIFSISRGKRKGFSDTFVKVILLAVAIFAGAFFTGNFNRLLKFVHLDKLINSRLSINLENADFDFATAIPSKISSFVSGISDTSFLNPLHSPDISQNSPFFQKLGGATETVISFSITFLIIWIIASFLRRFFRKKFSSARKNGIIVGGVDKIFGMIFGFIKGVIVVFVLLALMFPVTHLFSPEFSTVLTNQLGESIFTLWLYDNNPIYELLALMRF